VLRAINSHVACALSRHILGLHYTDPTSGYRVYRREVLAQIDWDYLISDGPSIVEEVLYHLQHRGARIIEVNITYRQRHSGQSKLTLGIIVRWIVNLLRIRWLGTVRRAARVPRTR
jgi:dolichol-phosphate mannosyltransferase